jgi:uncharacterized protein
MLIRFAVENYLSFNERVELSMITGKYRLLPEHVIKRNGKRSPNLLKAAVVYGANASGKTNIVSAIAFGKRLVVRGTKAGDSISVRRFKLEKDKDSKLSRFQYDFDTDGTSYSYGFGIDNTRVAEEWLYEIGGAKDKCLFERQTSDDGQVTVNCLDALAKNVKERDFLSFVALGTRPNQLFLTESVERNMKHFEGVHTWFKNKLNVIFPRSRVSGLGVRFEKDEGKDQDAFLRLVQAFDTGISGFQAKRRGLEKTDLPEQIVESLMKDLKAGEMAEIEGPGDESYTVRLSKNGELEALSLATKHRIKNSTEEVVFDLGEESDGTRRIIDLVPAVSSLSKSGGVFIIDELDRSLHPHVTRGLLKTFFTQSMPDSQLIVTTHESSLLDLTLLRRDEIWFVDKNQHGESEVHSLEEFKPRYDKDIRKGYLLGRFGGIPVVRGPKRITAELCKS